MKYYHSVCWTIEWFQVLKQDTKRIHESATKFLNRIQLNENECLPLDVTASWAGAGHSQYEHCALVAPTYNSYSVHSQFLQAPLSTPLGSFMMILSNKSTKQISNNIVIEIGH